MDKKQIGIVAAILVLMGGAAAVASYATRESMDSKTVEVQPVKRPHQKIAAAQPQAQPQKPACDDKNIVGTVVGGVAGGVVGNQFGSGSGKTAATIGGVAGGALLGNEFIPTRNVTCP